MPSRVPLRLAACAAAVAGLVVGLPLPATASDTMTVCMGSPTPSGWVEVKYSTNYRCGRPGSTHNAKTIRKVTSVSPGGTVAACTSSPRPAGWAVTRYRYVSSCEISRFGSSNNNTQQMLVNLNGLPSGSIRAVCGAWSAPQGWAIVSRHRDYGCVYSRFGSPTSDNAATIRKF
ncbi:hypothetical protein GCM10012275_33790 [Longimycelium tulufanense]|uniref:Serine/threonine protein kinase n=1 Tax=Longimycelium tulufanense TaxID=907463 RepID=A0A8J3C9A9_9PSEU|nr:hypothetical protein GCM10012275_33790 [Longimycelium tulufanense]